MRKAIYLLCLAVSCINCAQAEFRIWEDRNGNTLEAEYIKIIGDKVSLRYPSGKIRQFVVSGFSDKDQTYLQLRNPPKLIIKKVERSGHQSTDYSNVSDLEVTGDNTTQLYSTVIIERSDRKKYEHSLILKVYWISHNTQHSENGGWTKDGRTILLKDVVEEVISPEKLDHKNPLTIKSGPLLFNRTYQLSVREVPKKLSGRDYIQVGRKYYHVSERIVQKDEGYMFLLAVILDHRNEVLAMASTEKKLLRYADKIMHTDIGGEFPELNDL